MAAASEPEKRQGDWPCPSCGANCFASRQACFKCGTRKDGTKDETAGKGKGKGGGAAAGPPQFSQQAPAGYTGGSTSFFDPCPSFIGERPGYVFKLDHMGLGYYVDPLQTLLPKVKEQLPERWRECSMREEKLKVDPTAGAGVALEPCEFGFLVERVNEEPGQNLTKGDVVVAVEGRMFVGISGDQMKASFLKRRVDGARLAVVRLEEVTQLNALDAAVIEGWDARNGCKYYFSKKSGLSAWSLEDLKAKEAPKAKEEEAPKAPVDLQQFLLHGFNKPLESEQDKIRKNKRKKETAAGKDESDLARAEKSRWNDWNEGGTGGYTEAFFAKYRNCQAFEKAPKADKRLKGSVGPGLGMDKFEKWTGSKNSFN